LFYKNARSGILCSTTARDAKIFHNTFWNNGYYATKLAGTNCTNTQIRNNIFWQNIPGNILNSGAGTTDANNFTTDPKFIDSSKYDFRLQSGSPAIDKGATLSVVPTDFNGTKRPQGSGYDIGAFEYGGATISSGSGTSVTPQPAAPTQLQATSQ
jgi:hypothetical protein